MCTLDAGRAFGDSKRCRIVHRDGRIKLYCYSVELREKQSGTVKNIKHSQNDYHEHSKQVPNDWLSADFDAKCQEKELHHRDRNALKCLVTWLKATDDLLYTTLLQNITIVKQRLLARKLCKERVKWCIGRRGRAVNN